MYRMPSPAIILGGAANGTIHCPYPSCYRYASAYTPPFVRICRRLRWLSFEGLPVGDTLYKATGRPFRVGWHCKGEKSLFIDFNTLKLVSIPHLNDGEGTISARMFMAPEIKIMVSRLPPGASIGPHQHTTNSEINTSLAGSGTAVCDGNAEDLVAGVCHDCPKGVHLTVSATLETKTLSFLLVPEQTLDPALISNPFLSWRPGDMPICLLWHTTSVFVGRHRNCPKFMTFR